jgi:hypothetical protein
VPGDETSGEGEVAPFLAELKLIHYLSAYSRAIASERALKRALR